MSRAVSDSIYLADYDPRWPAMFEEERARLQLAIGEWAADIQHVGSTSIPGIAAKPIIDIAVALRSLADGIRCITPLWQLNYECRGEAGIPGRLFFRKLTDRPVPAQTFGTVARTHQIHMYEMTHPEWEKHLLFRDYLRGNSTVAKRYEQLKRDLALKHAVDVEAYAEAKTPFVQLVLGRARSGPPIAVRIVDYDPAWPAMYEEEKGRILEAAGSWLVGIEHVGSKSVQGLAAKPVIDIMAAVARLEDARHIIEPLAALGYDYVPEYEVELPERRYFRRGEPGSALHLFRGHLHVVEAGGAFWRRHLAFRDYLRAYPEDAGEYAELKRRLAVEHRTDVDAYTEAKSDFIRGIEKAAAAPSPSSPAAERGARATQ